MAPETIVAGRKRRHGYPTAPQVNVTTVRPPGMNLHTMIKRAPKRSSVLWAHFRWREPRSLEKILRSTQGLGRWSRPFA
jgi:hypothetical protein